MSIDRSNQNMSVIDYWLLYILVHLLRTRSFKSTRRQITLLFFFAFGNDTFLRLLSMGIYTGFCYAAEIVFFDNPNGKIKLKNVLNRLRFILFLIHHDS